MKTNTIGDADLRTRLTTVNALSRGDTILWTTFKREPQWGLYLSTSRDSLDEDIICLHVAPARPDWDDTIDLHPNTLIQRVLNPHCLPTKDTQ